MSAILKFGQFKDRRPTDTVLYLSGNVIDEDAANGTHVGDIIIIGTYTGTPSFSLTDASGTFQVNSSTGEVTVLDNTELDGSVIGWTVTLGVSGTTPDPSDREAYIVFIPAAPSGPAVPLPFTYFLTGVPIRSGAAPPPAGNEAETAAILISTGY